MNPCTLHFQRTDADCVSVSLFYDFREQPLTLRAAKQPQDAVTLTVTDAHLALYINGTLADEEWPCGTLDWDRLAREYDFTREDGVAVPEQPLRTGLTAEDLRLPGVFIGDCMPYALPEQDDRYHLYWLYDRHQHTSKWGLGAHQWAHASTVDLLHWDEHPMAVSITRPLEGSICTGSTIYDNGRYYCWYAIRMADYSPARLTYSQSDDGDHYTKWDDYFILPERYHRSSARDPKVIFHDGRFHMLVTTTLLASDCGCLAHLVSDHADMSDFTDLGPIMEWNNNDQPECPDYFEMGGRYYLVWSIGGRARYAYASEPFGADGWTIPVDNILDCGNVPKSAVCPWNGERVFIGFVPENGYAGHLIMKKAVQETDGRLRLADL